MSNITGRPSSDDATGQLITFDMLPDDVLIDIFGFYVDEDINEDLERTEVWKTRSEEHTSELQSP